MSKKDFTGWVSKYNKTYALQGQRKKIEKGQVIGEFEKTYMSEYAIECWFVSPDSKEGKAILANKELQEEKKEVKKEVKESPKK